MINDKNVLHTEFHEKTHHFKQLLCLESKRFSRECIYTTTVSGALQEERPLEGKNQLQKEALPAGRQACEAKFTGSFQEKMESAVLEK